MPGWPGGGPGGGAYRCCEEVSSSADANGLLEPVGIGCSGAASAGVGSSSRSEGSVLAGNGGGAGWDEFGWEDSRSRCAACSASADSRLSRRASSSSADSRLRRRASSNSRRSRSVRSSGVSTAVEGGVAVAEGTAEVDSRLS